ncbi:hypothetical protein WN51_08653 [Melipona quadrifasciata]|uniref:Uncharacterized protein n=1 Tax=Melipona quadrifasciata TaxID=166423 RepID=A0A0N0U6U5_9HYME|nr:hypothetical protein WN51_08653 [Melipona quadrifasciata]
MATIARHGRGMYRVLDPASDPNQFVIRGFWVNIEIHFSWRLERRRVSSTTAITASTIITGGFISASPEEKIDDLGGGVSSTVLEKLKAAPLQLLMTDARD